MALHENNHYIELQPMQELSEAINRDDDWTGFTDAAARRRRQNRLNVRAYRKRKALEFKEQPAPSSVVHKKRRIGMPETQIPCWVEKSQSVVLIPSSAVHKFYKASSPLIPWQHAESPDSNIANKISASSGIIFPLSPDHMITLLQYNVIRGLLTIRHLLSPIRPQSSHVNECSSAASHISPDLSSCPSSLPLTLYPTHLQQTIPHEEWVDSIPHPVWRDNVIRALGTFNEDQLWSDIMGGLFEGYPASEVDRRGVICWSTPWHLSGWEASEGFLRRWGWSMKGCESEILEATNKWRAMRGERPFIMKI